MRRVNITGQKFGRLTAIRYDHTSKGRACWLFKCDCGNSTISIMTNVKGGQCKSCGCLQKETRVQNGLKTAKHKMGGTRIYNIWQHMVNRSHKQKSKEKCYIGVTIDPRWLCLENFLEDMADGYADNLTLDRIDNNKGYCKENCRWATAKEQARNTNRNRIIEYSGKKMCASEWEELLGLRRGSVCQRIDRDGWSVEKALTTPVKGSTV